jgi:hypothetical protein
MPDAKKMLALNPAFPTSGLVNIQKTVKGILSDAPSLDVARARLAKYGNDPGLHSFVGQFQAIDDSQYESKVLGLLRRLVLPIEPPRVLESRQKPQSRLRTRLRAQFKNQGLFSVNPEDISNHKVVGQYPINVEQGLYAEFALQNGAMHVTETIDFDVQSSSLRAKVMEAQAKTFVLDAAADHFGRDTRRYVVVSGSYRKHAQPSVRLLEDHGVLFAVESEQDMGRYFDLIQAAVAAH